MEDSDRAEWPICGGDKGFRLSAVFMLSLGLILLRSTDVRHSF